MYEIDSLLIHAPDIISPKNQVFLHKAEKSLFIWFMFKCHRQIYCILVTIKYHLEEVAVILYNPVHGAQ